MARTFLIWIIVILAAAASTSLAYFYLPRNPGRQNDPILYEVPRSFEIRPDRVNFGTLIQGQTASREVTIYNGTSDNWIIDRVVPSCGCSAGAVTSQRLTAHSQVSLQVLFDSNGKFGDQNHVVRLFVHSEADAEIREQILVTLSANVKTIIGTDSEVSKFSACHLDGHFTEKFTLHCAEGHFGTEAPRLIHSAGATTQEFELLPSSPLKPGANEMEFRFSPKQSAGCRTVQLQIHPALFNHPPIIIRAEAVVPSAFRVSPNDATFGTLRPNESKTIRLRIADGKFRS